MELSIRQYCLEEDEREWNTFIKEANNSTFLFNRGFMDYHKQRFVDHSIMIYKKQVMIACLPANIDKEKGIVYSHQGLTYGGFIIKKGVKLSLVLEIFEISLKHFSLLGFRKIIYKQFPRIFNRFHTEELDFCLFKNNANLYRRDTALAVNYNHRFMYSGNIRREAKKAKLIGIVVEKSQDFSKFWDINLIPNLLEKHGVKPVHSKQEIITLAERFPSNIELYCACDTEGEILAGTVVFRSDTVVHCQYISSSPKGRKNGALNLLFTTLLDDNEQKNSYFDFGIANEGNGKILNSGLLAWKERMGGRSYVHDFYEINLKNSN